MRYRNMDTIFPKSVIGVPVISTRGLLLSKPYHPNYILPTSSNIVGVKREDNFAVRTKNHVGLRPKLIEIVKHKLSYGSKVLPFGHEGKVFRRSFITMDGEKLFHASRCCIYTTAGAITGILFISTERVGFCSDRSLKAYSKTVELLKFQYKVSIPLEKIKQVEESMNLKRPSKKYAELVTVDGFSFWFLGFPNYKKTLRYLNQKISSDCLSD